MRSAVLVSLSAVLLLVSCASRPERPPNVIWLNAEDISPGWGIYGDEYATTPYIDGLAREGIVYRNAFANAPICAPARSTFITGMYATSLGTEHLRSQIPRTPGIGTVAEYLRQAGYFTTNTGKTDYNFSAEGMFDFSGPDDAPWRNRPEGSDQPFFSVMTYGETHEGPSNRQEAYERHTAHLPEALFHDPAKIAVPPYHPDTPVMRRLWAQVADLMTVFDRNVANVFDNLRQDGLLDDTYVFIFGDHGYGMPRYKRWLNDTGVRVPLLVYVPANHRRTTSLDTGAVTEELVSFVDLAPTTLSLAGVDVPGHMMGRRFLGRETDPAPEYVYLYRGRADDMYEISRGIHDGRYIYVRHYLPYLPYVQPGRIFSDEKASFRELRRVRRSGGLPPESERMWGPKPPEELYDLETDPQELNNLANSPQHQAIKARLHEVLRATIIESRDVGLLMEPELMIRSEGSSPYEMARKQGAYSIEAILAAAELVGTDDIDAMRVAVTSADSGVRFWGVQALRNLGTGAAPARDDLAKALADSSPAVSIAAADALCAIGSCPRALPVLEKWALDDRPTTSLYAARTLLMVGEPGCAAIPVMRQVINKNLSPPGGERRYRDFNYASFTGWALEEALAACGAGE